MRSRTLLALVGLLLVVPASAVEARPVSSEAQLWYTVSAQGNISESFLYYLEAQPRVSEQDGRVIFRSAAGVRVLQDLSFWLGYAWVPIWNWEEHPALRQGESRLFQQLFLTPRFGELKTTLRARVEQRFLPGTTEVSHRARLMLRGAHPLAESRLSLVIWDEAFFHLNTVDGGPQRGFDTNRAFVGVSWKLGAHSAIEVGYLNAYVRRPSAQTDQLIHALAVSTPFNFM
ncbi:hypothetical protein MYSTI_05836 [Myxococcus stipitatus DSM 14675]|uniref:DUF2490 domain-containing protein n=1 Tax=Myxococcus stipitatus (strain DSM 14675 / JCM 12634 / Mx s8) TaxID=1278073 RepID=L7UHS1_MYXSD|nr:DUF2490 domain-containing protein [Myxococcus stipitatus]AGC47112.1 hypothetical protein MYSTI_05836 [Myxococcus stipitatus DSM 14675]